MDQGFHPQHHQKRDGRPHRALLIHPDILLCLLHHPIHHRHQAMQLRQLLHHQVIRLRVHRILQLVQDIHQPVLVTHHQVQIIMPELIIRLAVLRRICHSRQVIHQLVLILENSLAVHIIHHHPQLIHQVLAIHQHHHLIHLRVQATPLRAQVIHQQHHHIRQLARVIHPVHRNIHPRVLVILLLLRNILQRVRVIHQHRHRMDLEVRNIRHKVLVTLRVVLVIRQHRQVIPQTRLVHRHIVATRQHRRVIQQVVFNLLHLRSILQPVLCIHQLLSNIHRINPFHQRVQHIPRRVHPLMTVKSFGPSRGCCEKIYKLLNIFIFVGENYMILFFYFTFQIV